MRSVFAVAKRILQQFKHDRRTLAILFIAPCVVLWLFSVLLGAPGYPPRLAVVEGVPQTYLDHLQNQRCSIVETDADAAEDLLAANDIDAVLSMGEDRTLNVKVEGADATRTSATVSTVRSALVETQRQGKDELLEQVDDLQAVIDSLDFDIDARLLALLPDDVRESIEAASDIKASMPDIDKAMPLSETQVSFLHGSEDWTAFEFYGPVFIGIFIFVFVFLTSSMSLLTERTGGTIQRLMSTPIKNWQIVGGYVVGFGLLALVQNILILWFCISVVGFPNTGSVLLVVVVTVSMAIVSLTLGLLVSGLAHTPFQVIQLMVALVVPQILLSGIFDLSQTPDWMQVIATFFPVSYGAEALRDVMLRGADLQHIAGNLAILWGFIVVFFVLSCLNYRKKRA